MLGAEVHAVPVVAYENTMNYNHQARDYAKNLPGAIWTDQFDNTTNVDADYISTGPEIWEKTQGDLDGFICSTGRRGTLAGVGKYLKEKSGGKTHIWLVDPPGMLHSYVTSGGEVQERSGSFITEGLVILPNPSKTCSSFTEKYLAGIGQGRITKNLATLINDLSGSMHIPDEKSIAMVYELLDTEGLYLGASSALNVAAVELAVRLGRGTNLISSGRRTL
jgi:cysteine synthase A